MGQLGPAQMLFGLEEHTKSRTSHRAAKQTMMGAADTSSGTCHLFN